MCFLPQTDNLVKMRCRNLQDVLHIAALGIAWANCIATIRFIGPAQGPRQQVDDYLSLSLEAVHVTRFMVLRIGNKPHAIEP
jgi:hypothetical protein